jgi:hypothetical protein
MPLWMKGWIEQRKDDSRSVGAVVCYVEKGGQKEKKGRIIEKNRKRKNPRKDEDGQSEPWYHLSLPAPIYHILPLPLLLPFPLPTLTFLAGASSAGNSSSVSAFVSSPFVTAPITLVVGLCSLEARLS